MIKGEVPKGNLAKVTGRVPKGNLGFHRMKALIFDSSTLITLSMNSLLDILAELKKKFNGKFIVTEPVKYETVSHPMKIKRFELEALRINELLLSKVLEMPSSLGIKDDEIDYETKKILGIANAEFSSGGRNIHLIEEGEASCVALSKILSKKGIENIVAVDERTTRMLYEKPLNLHKLLGKKLHRRISINKDNLSFFSDVTFIRSSEIVYVAYKKGFIKLHNSALDALLYATKFKGNSISQEEIEEIKRM